MLVYSYVLDLYMRSEANGPFIGKDPVDGNVDLAVITTLLLTSRMVALLRGFDRTGMFILFMTLYVYLLVGYIS